MMKVIAIICSLTTNVCREETVTNSDLSDITMNKCEIGMPALADWMSRYPTYRLQSWKCVVSDNHRNAA